MADQKTSALTPAVALVGDELIPAVQAGGNVSLTTAQIAALASPVAIAVYAADKTALDLITDQSDNALGLTLDTATLYLWDDTGEAWVEIGPLRGPAGADGPAIELQLSETHVQWRVVGDEAWTDLVALSEITGPAGATTLAALTDVDLDTTAPTDGQALVWDEASETWIPGDAGTPDTFSGTIDGATLETYSETLYSPAAITASTLTIDLANGHVQRFTINPDSSPCAITLPSDPGALAKSFVLMIENASGKAHSWAASPAIKWVSEADSDTVPTPAAATYLSIYSFVWDDNDAGTGRWLGWLSGRETA